VPLAGKPTQMLAGAVLAGGVGLQPLDHRRSSLFHSEWDHSGVVTTIDLVLA
jgi:hypothetical protein